ncbi:polysaccharide deacetylase family protein [Reichenbachiella versicolor]|uniref:polysaccharide deacetylase family protein n=1 Tax=Reichenbachiella versicolor TaxID=1821036 RepID=UPI000D6E7D05|nr:polysaccharide deacetylase family protein [Reichenbachiella versicolor]
MAKRVSAIWSYIFPSILWNKKIKEKKILYLTFDDGPTPMVTDYVLRELESRNAKATFFALGKNLETEVRLVKEILGAGHQLANHTYNHDSGWRVSSLKFSESISRTDALLNRYLKKNTCSFRPPYGKLTPSQFFKLKKTHQIIMWNLMSYDFDQSLSPERCLESLKQKTRSGDIVVFHDNSKSFHNLGFVLPRYLDHCLSQGYEFKLL